MTVDLSVVLPCYRAAELAARSVAELRHALGSGRMTWEIILVDDGGGDFPAEAWVDAPDVSLVRLPRNRGKGAAVRAGMEAATGCVRIYTDVDLPYGTALIPVIASYLLDHRYHVVIGDRSLPASSYLQRLSPARRLLSRMGTEMIGRLVTGGFFDTQCGLKAVRGDVAAALFPLLRVDRFIFDVELVYVALKHRLDVKRVPVQLKRNETSSVRPVRDSVRALLDLARIKWYQVRGRYGSLALDAIAQDDFARIDEHARSARRL